MKSPFLALALLAFSTAQAQELFVFTEPASNMAAGSIGVRANNFLTTDPNGRSYYHFAPEVMAGVSKRIMVHGDAFFNNLNRFSLKGGSVYAKYRFYSADEVQQHFRMALFGRYSYNTSLVDAEDIFLYDQNSGWEGGLVATRLKHKVALSSSLSYVQAMDNGDGHQLWYGEDRRKALNYTLSFGKLMLPREYKNYNQTNLNLLFELLSQYNLGSGRYYLDAAPSLQVILCSVGRVDLGYRRQVSGTYLRNMRDMWFLRLEYNFFNVYGNRKK